MQFSDMMLRSFLIYGSLLHKRIRNYFLYSDWWIVFLMIVFISNYSSFHIIQFFPGIFETYLETLFDIMGDFATQKGNRMSLESFQSFVSETEIFSAHDSNTLTAGRSNMCRSHHGVWKFLRSNCKKSIEMLIKIS